MGLLVYNSNMKKQCIGCGELKDIEEYVHKSRSWLNSRCELCTHKYNKQYHKTHKKERRAYEEANKELIKERSKQYQKDNREKIALKAKIYRKDNKEEIAIWRKNYLNNNKERESRRRKEYYKKNREKLVKQTYQNNKKKRENDPDFSLVEKLRNNTRRYFSNNIIKSHTTEELIGSDWETATDYLKNLGYDQTLHHLDHIIPLSAFDVQNENHQKVMFHYTNLQPVDPYYNIGIKQSRLLPDWKEIVIKISNVININPIPIVEYIESQNIPILHKKEAV